MFSNFYLLFTLTNLSMSHFYYTNLSALAGAKTPQHRNNTTPKQLGAKRPAPNSRCQNGGAKKYPTLFLNLALVFFIISPGNICLQYAGRKIRYWNQGMQFSVLLSLPVTQSIWTPVKSHDLLQLRVVFPDFRVAFQVAIILYRTKMEV